MSDQTSQEPTMEEILASIRRIISEDDVPADEGAPAEAAGGLHDETGEGGGAVSDDGGDVDRAVALEPAEGDGETGAGGEIADRASQEIVLGGEADF